MLFDEAFDETNLETERLRLLVDRLRQDLAASRTLSRSLVSQVEELERAITLRSMPIGKTPKWLTRKTKHGKHRGVVCTIFSDAHLDEVVNPDEINGVNAYDRTIAKLRFERYIDGVVYLTRSHLTGVEYDGVVMMLGGDLVSGSIHDELRETNAGTLPDTVAHWVPILASGIEHLANEYGQVHIPVVVGNHGRLTRKSRAKLRAVDNIDWLIGQLLAQRFANDPRVTFTIPEATDATVTVYDTKFLLTHGDQTNGGGGIGGIWPPIMRLRARKLARERFDWMVMGHWHQYIHGQGIIVNGSSKGYDEYASVMNFGVEPPQQALWIVTPEHGVTWAAPIFVADRASEGW